MINETDISPQKRLEKSIQEYFQSEKTGGLLSLAWGTLGALVGVWLLTSHPEAIYQGMAAPLLVFASIHLAIGSVLFLRSGGQAKRILSAMPDNNSGFLGIEQKRMEAVMANFKKFINGELFLFFLGGAFIAFGMVEPRNEYMIGGGIGLGLQSAFTLVFDLFASFRGGLYVHELDVFERDN